MEPNLDYIESVNIRDMQTLCIDMGSDYLTVTYAGTVSGEKQFIWSAIDITEGGASLTSYLLSIKEVKERLEDLTFRNLDKYPEITTYLNNK